MPKYYITQIYNWANQGKIAFDYNKIRIICLWIIKLIELINSKTT